MTTADAITFLESHQPLPADGQLSDELIARFDEVRVHFMEEPDSRCIPLLLHSFGDGSGFGVYQLCDDVLRQFDSREVIPHLEAALRSEHRGVRYWAAHWSMEFPDEALVQPLEELLNRMEDEDAHYYALASLEFLLDAAQNDRAMKVIKDRKSVETDPERLKLIHEILRKHQ